MSLSFFINGKEYIPSNTLCASFVYTPDYISKLAREEKVLGTLVGRQWFIEEQSLKTYVSKIAFEKEIFKEEVSLQRKSERVVGSGNIGFLKPEVVSAFGPVACAQTVAIMLLGLFVGNLGWTSLHAGVALQGFSDGVKVNAQRIAEVISPVRMFATISRESDLLFATAFVSNAQTQIVDSGTQFEVFTQLPQLLHRDEYTLESTYAEESHVAANQQFSDEVRLVTDETGRQMIEPVFKTTSATPSRFIVVPVTDIEN